MNHPLKVDITEIGHTLFNLQEAIRELEKSDTAFPIEWQEVYQLRIHLNNMQHRIGRWHENTQKTS